MANDKTNIKTKWVLDPSHSELTFKVKHLMISNVKGEFEKFTAEIDEIDFLSGKVTAVIDTSSIFTNSSDRDNHLRGSDFFDVEKFPTSTFTGISLVKVDDAQYILKGVLDIKGIVREVNLNVEFGGTNKDPWGNEKAGFSFEGTINRKEWGLNWNAMLESGGVLVSDEVKIAGELQFVKK